MKNKIRNESVGSKTEGDTRRGDRKHASQGPRVSSRSIPLLLMLILLASLLSIGATQSWGATPRLLRGSLTPLP